MLKHLVRKAIERTERKHILAALTHRHWNRKQAARDLAISYRSMLYKIEYYRLDPPELEPPLDSTLKRI